MVAIDGWFGRYLDVDLGNEATRDYDISRTWLETHLGGRGVATRILLRETSGQEDPLGPGNLLIFATGPFQGTGIPGAGRHAVVGRSPKTGSINEAYAGGFWAHELGTSGYDGIIIRGKADAPCYVALIDGTVEIDSADDLWGLKVAETEAVLKERHPGARVASIGPAGEKEVMFSCVVNDRNRAAGRPGFGAVMGAKRLKAIVVKGNTNKAIHNNAELRRLTKEFSAMLTSDPGLQVLGRYGTVCGVGTLNELGMLPTKNFQEGIFNQAHRIGEASLERILARRDNCTGCPVRCKRVVKTTFHGHQVEERYGGPEYETVAAFGSLCLNGDLDSIALANQKCNAYGLDTISTGVVLAFVMEATERGLLDTEEGLAWGDAKGMLAMIDRVVAREGLGDLLAQGLKAAAEHLGADFAMHAKGLEFPLHDPRGKKGLAISYATSPRGPTHLEAMHDEMFEGNEAPTPELGITQPINRLSWENKASLCKAYEDLYSFVNSLIICGFVSWNRAASKDFYPFPMIRKLLDAITGRSIDVDEMMRIGERNYVIRRLATARDGFSQKDDRLPGRMREPLPAGASAGETVPDEVLRKTVGEYYQLRGFDDRGPIDDTLKRLGLEELIQHG